ncbi:ABC transporter ATP-binding protein [Acidipropionibacterium jensenii]|uniref:ABC-type transporter ATP-binding protein EcsA n=5 Tax=Acidipropionibacterium jensenii TaxID=1749 RepID=A0A448NZW1_9ACTN|nr:ATP-binding cassette domain-containing protein [Acidipropionibacterium jensenii]MDN5995536.1 ATP-binding cassette domain-containing protein [Acidipropionibacterium jensenii]MDN6442705.1 ATP-binding cassette domain-containing protein [Acidipropionibacterium jensenii]MDN6481411.1 ATP-binding cassette domain-containing protein [Acidipropionibacterium jensenii]MDN6624613.1 ATP-binding cassette domain-containing protein [Acidipropionibacterium jensenii]MDN6761841.1 ATP-binding cassette domain-co
MPTTGTAAESGITISSVSKSFGRTEVLHSIDLQLPPNQVYGLLGSNGVGKTTLMSIICNHIFPTSGEVLIDGRHPAENAEILERTCFIHEDQRWHDDFTLDILMRVAPRFFARWSAQTAETLAERFRLPRRTRLKKMSRGQRSALAITISLASRAPYTFLDEPYLGLDPSARSIFYSELLQEISEVPRTVIMSTHLIDEAASLMEDVILMRQGHVEMHADVDSITSQSFTVRGLSADVAQVVAGLEVLSRKSMGRIESTMVRGNLNGQAHRRAEELHVSIEPAGLQDLVAALGVMSEPASTAPEGAQS